MGQRTATQLHLKIKNQSIPEDMSITKAVDSTADLKSEDGDICNIWL